ncbi:MAG: diguanylate cyclase, partial [Pseudomonadota bacterium]|nr:diguanylate cyclase [Pseudomonadota bacterium]
GWRPAPDGGDLLAPSAVRGDGLAPGGAPSPDPVAALRAARARAAALPGASIACDAPLRDADGRIDRARLSVRRLGRGPRAPWLHELAPADPDRVVARLRQALDRAEKAQRQLAILAETAPVALFEYLAHPDERVEVPYFNARLPENMGVTAAEIEADGAAMLAHIPPEDLEAMRASIDETVATRRAQGFSFRVMHPAKGERQLVAWATPAPQPDGAVLWYCANFDVTAQRDAEARAEEADAELRRARERLSDVAEIAPVGLYEFRMGPDGALSFPLLSARATELLGWSDRSRPPGPDRVFDRIVPDDLPGLMASIAESRTDLSRWNRRMRVRDGARGVIWVQGASSPRADPDGGVTWRGVLFDVTEDVRREEELKRAHRLAEAMRIENERQALHDGLTALPNRRAYDRTLEARIEAARAGTLPPGCILVRIDLDHFKHVNDTLGHEAGDHVLRRVADVLRARLRAGDFAARIGGDEFSVLLSPGASVAQAEEVVARIQTDLAEPLLHAGRQCRFGASFGLAEADLTDAGMEIQIFADAALYRAKSAGRNRLELFTPELHRSILDDRAMATELQEALERDEFTPFFQPQVDARDGRLVGAETLLRWRHPTRGLLAPDRFMHVAAQLRLVNEVDRRMMLRTGEVLDRWARLGFTPPKVSFNVSAGRMHDADVVDIARQLAARPCKIAMELL